MMFTIPEVFVDYPIPKSVTHTVNHKSTRVNDRTMLSICMGHSGEDCISYVIVHSRWIEVA